MSVSTKKWKDRGKGRGYGYVSEKTKKFICGKKKLSPDKHTEIPGERFRDSLPVNSSDKSGDHSARIKGKVQNISEWVRSDRLQGMK